MIRLVVSDVDGTLLKRGQTQIEEQTISAIQDLRKRGIFFAAASGRAYPDLRRLFSPIAEEIAYLASDGALVCSGKTCIQQFPMQRETAFSFLRDIWKMTEAEVILYGRYFAYVVPKSKKFESLVRLNTNGHMKKVDCMRNIEEEYLKIGIYHEQDVHRAAGDILGYFKKQFHMVYDSREWIEFTAPGVHKGTGLEALMETLNLNRSEVMAFGDNRNDLEMLSLAGKSIAMVDAIPEVKRLCGQETKEVVEYLKNL